jgi:hypothetical protein
MNTTTHADAELLAAVDEYLRMQRESARLGEHEPAEQVAAQQALQARICAMRATTIDGIVARVRMMSAICYDADDGGLLGDTPDIAEAMCRDLAAIDAAG